MPSYRLADMADDDEFGQEGVVAATLAVDED
jgi:hypothetical protein